MTTVGALVAAAAGRLAGSGDAGDQTAATTAARELVSAAFDKPRSWTFAHRADPVPEETAASVLAAAEAMRQGIPLAYAVGKAAFRHLTLHVDRRVLIPRPETELLVDLALAATAGRGRIADIGTGSGAIALALASEGQFDAVVGTDISPEALAVAMANLATIPAVARSRVSFRAGDLCAPLLGERFAAVVSNPPYIADVERAELPSSVRDWEPACALFGGPDGMDVIDRLLRDAPDVVAAGGFLLLEVDVRRAALVAARAEHGGRWSDVQIRPDLTGRDRFVVARRTDR